MKCPEHDELAAWIDRELPERRASEVGEHAASCTVCKAAIEKLEKLIGELRAPALVASTPAQTARTMARLDEMPRRAPIVWIGGALVAAAIAVVVLVRPHEGSTFTARGGSGESLAKQVGVNVYTLATRAEPLAANAMVTAATPFVVGYRDLATTPVWLLAFAVDARGDVHWLYPAYSSGDPAAALLTAGASETLMTDAAILDHPAPGPLRIVSLVAPAIMHVSQIEALHGEQLSVEALRTRFPAAVISELRVVVQ